VTDRESDNAALTAIEDAVQSYTSR